MTRRMSKSAVSGRREVRQDEAGGDRAEGAVTEREIDRLGRRDRQAGRSRRATPSMSSDGSIPTTAAPAARTASATTPVPVPTSSTTPPSTMPGERDEVARGLGETRRMDALVGRRDAVVGPPIPGHGLPRLPAGRASDGR